MGYVLTEARDELMALRFGLTEAEYLNKTEAEYLNKMWALRDKHQGKAKKPRKNSWPWMEERPSLRVVN